MLHSPPHLNVLVAILSLHKPPRQEVLLPKRIAEHSPSKKVTSTRVSKALHPVGTRPKRPGGHAERATICRASSASSFGTPSRSRSRPKSRHLDDVGPSTRSAPNASSERGLFSAALIAHCVRQGRMMCQRETSKPRLAAGSDG